MHFSPYPVWRRRDGLPLLVAGFFLVVLAASPQAARPLADLPAQPPMAPADTVAAPGEALPVVEHELENGLRLVVLPRDGAPTVTFVVQYEVGSVHEALGYTGIAHMLEHMLFKGTTTVGTRDLESELALFEAMDAVHDSILAERGRRADEASDRLAALEDRLRALEDSARALVEPNELDRILTRHGAQSLNAMTTTESTIYFVQLPANRARLWFVLEADRMRNPVFREFYTERDVVAEERRTRIETSPSGLLSEVFLAAAFRVHPYGVPVVGHMSDIRNYGRHQVEEYYRRYYGPNNAVVSIVGDVEPDSVIAWAEAYFAPIPRGEAPRPVLAEEPPQRGERRVEVLFDAEPRLMIGWRVPQELHADGPSFSVLANILVGGRTSRLYRRLVVEDRIAQSVTAGTMPGSRHPRLFVIEATPRAPHTTEEVEAAIYEELARLVEAPPAEDEIRRIRNRAEAADVRRLQSNFGLAFQLAHSVALYDDWRTTFRYSRRVAEVEAEDVSRVVADYFVPERRTVGTLRRGEASAAAGYGGVR